MFRRGIKEFSEQVCLPKQIDTESIGRSVRSIDKDVMRGLRTSDCKSPDCGVRDDGWTLTATI